MEDTLRVNGKTGVDIHIVVLILVLMEDTLRVEQNEETRCTWCLNPYSNGRYSQSTLLLERLIDKSLNPCSNGRDSQSFDKVRGKVNVFTS